MSNALPSRQEAQQLHRLRTLRVDRARQACREAQAVVQRAEDAIRVRQRQIDRQRGEIAALARAVVHGLAPRLPRWSTVAVAQREALADRLEREEYALITDEQQLEEAQEALQRARAVLTRALAREDAVHGLVQETRRAHLQAREQRSERELEDQAAPNHRGR